MLYSKLLGLADVEQQILLPTPWYQGSHLCCVRKFISIYNATDEDMVIGRSQNFIISLDRIIVLKMELQSANSIHIYVLLWSRWVMTVCRASAFAICRPVGKLKRIKHSRQWRCDLSFDYTLKALHNNGGECLWATVIEKAHVMCHCFGGDGGSLEGWGDYRQKQGEVENEDICQFMSAYFWERNLSNQGDFRVFTFKKYLHASAWGIWKGQLCSSDRNNDLLLWPLKACLEGVQLLR